MSKFANIFALGNTHFAAMAALLNIVGLGMTSAFTATAGVDMKRPGGRFPELTTSNITWMASLPSITVIFGSFFSGFLSSRFGRKHLLMYTSPPFLISWLVIAYAPTLQWIYGGRLLSGLCTGLYSVVVPAYIIEIATVEIRGLLGSCFQVSYSVGVLIVMSFGIFFRWSWIAIIGALFAATSACLMYFMPESPTWLYHHGRNLEAIEALGFLRGKSLDRFKEYCCIADHIGGPQRNSIRFADLKKPELYKPIALSIALVFFQQFSGISAFMAYTVEIFEHAESYWDPSVCAAVVAVAQVIGSLVGSTLVDRVGRTTLYKASGISVTSGLVVLGIYGVVSKELNLSASRYGLIPLAGFMLFVFAFSVGFGPIPNLMTPEFVPIQSRDAVLAISGVFSSIFLFVVTQTFHDLRYFLSDYGIYWIYGCFSLLGCLFCWLCLPETKGKSIGEIQQAFANGS